MRHAYVLLRLACAAVLGLLACRVLSFCGGGGNDAIVHLNRAAGFSKWERVLNLRLCVYSSSTE